MVRKLLLLNGIAALALPFHHAAAFGFQAMFEWTNRYRAVTVPNYDQLNSLSYFALLLVRQLDQFALPAFMFVSGFFVAFMARGDGSKFELKWVLPRVRKFIAPFVIWTAISIVFIAKPSTFGDLLDPYYYIPLLIQYYLLSPLIVPLAARHGKILLISAALIQLGLTTLHVINQTGMDYRGLEQTIRLPSWLFPNLFFAFTLGVVVSLHRQQFSKWLSRYKWPMLVALITLASLSMIEYMAILQLNGNDWLGPTFVGFSATLYAFTFIFTLLAFDNTWLPFKKELSDLGGKSLGIYLANIPVIYVVGSILYHKVPWVLGQQLLYQTVLVLVGLFGPLLLMTLLRHSAAKGLYRYVFG